MVLLCERLIGPGDLDPGQGRAVGRAFELCRRADGGTELPVDREEATEPPDRTMWFLDAVGGALGAAGGRLSRCGPGTGRRRAAMETAALTARGPLAHGRLALTSPATS